MRYILQRNYNDYVQNKYSCNSWLFGSLASSELPAFLTSQGGLNSGFMIAHCTAAALGKDIYALSLNQDLIKKIFCTFV